MLKYETIVGEVQTNLPDTKLVISCIAPREDSHKLQRYVDWINACLNRKFGESSVTVVLNNDIRGKRLKRRDGIHLTEDGTFRLASHMNRGVRRALNIN